VSGPRAAYLEAHSALNGSLLAYGLLPVAVEAACLAVSVTADQAWLSVAMGAVFAFLLASVDLLYRNWPTGIRLDETGITIGAVRSARASRRRPTVNHQAWGRYTCPWPAVLEARVVTDREELRRMKDLPQYYTLTNRWTNKAGMRHCNIGVLSSPFMRAALVIEVNPVKVTVSESRPARFYTNFKDGQFSHLVRPQPGLTWVVPTRHPMVLQAMLHTALGTLN
jgi:hypothetical protein